MSNKKKGKFSDIIKGLNINETKTMPVKKPKVFTKISDVVMQRPDYNFMSDILMLPTTKEKYNQLLVVVDLATHEFDMEPMKSKTPDDVLSAMKKMFKRPYLKMPFSSVATDGGNEFKGDFDKFLKEHKIFHKVAGKGRHTQQSMVESLNKTLGRLFNGYMNTQEEKKNQRFNEWTDIVDSVRKSVNKYRKIDKLPDIFELPAPSFLGLKSKFKEGDMVYYQYDIPHDALGKEQPTQNFRMGDYRWSKFAKKIIQVLYMNGKIPFRYMLEGMPNVSYTEAQLKEANDVSKETQFEVKKIIDKQVLDNGNINYKVWFKGELKAKAIFIDKKELIKDGLQSFIDEYDEEMKKKKKK